MSSPDLDPAPPAAVSSIVISMGLLALGNGLMFAYVPVRLASQGIAPWVAGAIITAVGAGALAGCLVTGNLVRMAGHARVFASLAALNILTVLLIAAWVHPLLWVLSRALYGFAMTGIFVVAQSWLNDACSNTWRGRMITVFYMTYVVCIGLGAYLLRFISLNAVQGPLLAIFFAALAILPVGLTRLIVPTPPENVRINIRAMWEISPVGFMGLAVVGGLTMLVQGFVPIYVASIGYAKDDIALLMLLMQLGMLAVQLPLGALSDRIDRRIVLVLASGLIVVAALAATRSGAMSFLLVIVVFAVWAGATETIYAVANAHANDRAEPEYFVAVSSTLLVAWSVSGSVVPAIATVLTPLFGAQAFMYLAASIAGFYTCFVLLRLSRRGDVPEDEQQPYQPVTAQAPLMPDMAPLPDPPGPQADDSRS